MPKGRKMLQSPQLKGRICKTRVKEISPGIERAENILQTKVIAYIAMGTKSMVKSFLYWGEYWGITALCVQQFTKGQIFAYDGDKPLIAKGDVFAFECVGMETGLGAFLDGRYCLHFHFVLDVRVPMQGSGQGEEKVKSSGKTKEKKPSNPSLVMEGVVQDGNAIKILEVPSYQIPGASSLEKELKNMYGIKL